MILPHDSVLGRFESGPGEGYFRELPLRLLAMPTDQLESAIMQARARVMEFFGLKFSMLLEVEEGNETRVTAYPGPVSTIGKNSFPGLPGDCPVCQRVLRGEFLRLPGGGDARPDAPDQDVTICGLGFKSALGFPLFDGGRVLGAVVFAGSQEQGAWADEMVAQLEYVARIFASALVRKRAEAACRREAVDYKSLLESARAMVWRADAVTLQDTFISTTVESTLSSSREDCAKPRELWAERIHPDDREQVLACMREAADEKRDCDFQHRVLTADGRTVWMQNVAHVVVENGQARELVGVGFDITERKLLEVELQESEAFVSCVFESLHSEVVVLDKHGTITAVNGAWNRFACENGIDPAAVSAGVNYLDVCRRAAARGDGLAGQVLAGIGAVLEGSRAEILLEYPCDAPTAPRHFAMRVSPLRAREGGVVIVHSDITPLRQSQESLRQAISEVERLKSKLQEENVYLRQRVRVHNDHHRMIGQSQAIRRMLDQAEQVAPTDSTVLLLGETGTGKELLAAFIHDASARRNRTLVVVNCAALPGPLVESELFGREKGAFTGSLSRQVGRFELADDSTIFLDEVGELPLEVQAKLLRVLESRQLERLGNPRPVQVNVRIITATNRDLEQEVADGEFRQDLYYRLNVFPISVPPLRERREDIPLLVWAFVDEFAKKFNKNIESVMRESMDALQRYAWPGNIRELRNLVERAMIMASGPKLRIQLPPVVASSPSVTSRKLEEVEREHVLSVLEKSGWRVRGPNGAAETLGLKPTTLEARMAKLGIRRPNDALDAKDPPAVRSGP
jgi:PAS domain S-box-containing protein